LNPHRCLRVDTTFWCGRGDLNPHAFRHRLLRPACLPFHHSRGKDKRNGLWDGLQLASGIPGISCAAQVEGASQKVSEVKCISRLMMI
jgi:hypothetical protein